MKQRNKDTAVPHIRKLFWTRLRKEKYLQFMALCGVAWMLVFNYIPMYGILIAFKKNFFITTPLFGKKFFETAWAAHFGFQHFIDFFHDEEFFNIIKNTLGISIFKLLINFPLPIVFALLLNEVRSAGFKRWVQTISYMPHFLSWVVLGGILTTWLSESGLCNDILIKTGIISQGIPF